MTILVTILAMIVSIEQLNAQVDTSRLLKEAETKLSDRSATASTILSAKEYLPIHPHTPFRELLKNHAPTGSIRITTQDEPGKLIRVIGMVTDQQGQPVIGALVYLYQTDSRGWYAAASPHVQAYEGDHRHARLFGYVKTDSQGQFELVTVKPSGYPRSDLPAHIHIHITSERYHSFGTELLFDDDDRLKGRIRENAIRSKFIIAKPETVSPPFDQQFSYAITLEKTR